MDLSSIDWTSFVKGLTTGLGAWAIWTVLKDGWTTIEADDKFDVFDDDEPIRRPVYVGNAGVSKATTIRRTPRNW
jgi:hypothetical protein